MNDVSRDVLRDVFGHAELRPGQREAIDGVLGGRDVVVLLPTGAGKSSCYQVPAVALARSGQGTTVVVSPLIALMNDQVGSLEARGVAAAAVHSQLDDSARGDAIRAFVGGELAVLYVSPERAVLDGFKRMLGRTPIALVAIDEAHCVSQWGHDFRPEYMRLHELREVVAAPVVALTATATPRVLHEIVRGLALRNPVIVRGDFRRPNLAFAARVRSRPTAPFARGAHRARGARARMGWVRSRDAGWNAHYSADMLARTDDMRDALVWLNGRIRRFRYTAIFEFDGRDLHTILLYDRNLGTFTTSGVMPVAASYCDYVRAFERSLWIADSVVDARVAVDHPKRDVFKAYCGAPLRDGTGRIFGTLCHFDPSAASLRHEDAAALIAAAAIVGPRFAAGSTAGLVGALAAAIDVPDGSQSRADELAALVASAFDGITTFDRDGNVRLVNEAAISHFGSTRDELAASWRGLLRNAASDHVDPDDRDPVTRALRGEAVTVSASIAGRLITLTASPVRDDCDAITGALLITQDMTDTARLTSQVREHARMLELDAEVGRALATAGGLSDVLRDAADVVVRLLDAACVRVWTLDDPSEGLTLVASAGCDTRLDGANARVPVEALEIDRIAANREPLLTNDLATEQEWARREAMVAFAGYPLVVGGRLVGVIAMFARRTLSVAVLTAMRVIATGMAQTVERHRAEQRCAASQNLLVTTLASIGDAVISVDSERCVTYVNAMAANLTGWTLDEARGRLLAEVFALVHEATGAPLSNLVDVVLEGGRVVTGANHAMLQRRDGTLLPIENSAAPIRVGDGPVLGVVLVFRDATQSRAIEHEQQRLLALEQIAHRTADEARAAAEHAIAVKDDFLARVSHDLRNPLGAILAWTALLRDEHTASGRAGKGLKIIEHNARAQVQLIEDLLDVARISSGKLRVKLATVDVAAAIVGALEPTDFAASAKGVSLVRFIDPEIGAIVADPDRFQQILWNLVSNAVKFTPTGGRVTVRAERTGSEVVIEVADTGAGIDPAFLPFVFNKFEQATTSSTRSGGLGLGLAIVHSLVERHGGTIRAESEGLGHGATFTVRLPIHAARQNTDRRNDTGTVPGAAAPVRSTLQGEQTKNSR